jgi:hypothetical protein
MASNVRALAQPRAEIERANAAAFGPQHFKMYADLNSVAGILRNELGYGGGDKVFVLGDNQILYVLLQQDTPYQVNTYNSSPIEEQRHVVAWLESNHTKFVVWQPALAEFDGVPDDVRVPVIYDYIIRNYVPLRRAGDFEILRLKRPDEALDVRFWRDRLGNSIYLGHLPEEASLEGAEGCRGAACDPIVIVRVPVKKTDMPGHRVSIGIRSGQDQFSILFDTNPAKREYNIDLNRVWFWRASNLPIGQVQFLPSDPEMQLSVANVKQRDNVLW